MRDFDQLASQERVARFLGSKNGTLFVISDERGLPITMVRLFDTDLRPASIPKFVKLVRNCGAWIASVAALAELVRVEQPTEVGVDFVARPYHIYYTSTRTYTNPDSRVAAPPELDLMRAIFADAIASAADPADKLAAHVLSRNLLNPSGKTYWHEYEHQLHRGGTQHPPRRSSGLGPAAISRRIR